ncbi:uncharacterized protein PFL1_06078 [Pseudozyma flocculosa PF-1]|uniref:E3 ubiquitin-protein ligase listerin n=2 Tax=Pseudozyma flocculosa TaxID=84751 RepID=A0A5C3F4T8_9BASI|nr:uncharacterized protein PFL1_06078 [Pseudozyma flocculosa PF-1]EPQ26430.1 hypothetical protein PFL1_06078 [Pseudozyma flocculosa PF-1]SPO38976.1 related to RKR1 - RING domain E3 ubiquitin ligase [Pseudozyma flocculosa]
MAKGGARGKSSASSATRKKQAAKAAKKVALERDADGNLLHPEAYEALQKPSQPAQRGQKKDKNKGKDGKGKGKGKSDRKKQFIPPPKPPQPLPDPLDSMGLASLLPADLVVLLRKASKKDVVTRCRALEGLLAWIEDALRPSATGIKDADVRQAARGDRGDDSGTSSEEKREALVMMLPCWVHLFPRLALSPTRRLRLLTSQIQSLLLQKAPDDADASSSASSSTRTELLQSPSYVESMLGPWAILSYDIDRSIERIGRATWNSSVAWQPSAELGAAGSEDRLVLPDYLELLIEHIGLLLQSPSPSAALALTSAHASGLTGDTPSAAASGVSTPALAGSRDRDAKNRDDTNVEEDTAALDKRLVAGALSVLSFIVQQHPSPKPIEALEPLLSSKLLWSSMSPANLFAGHGSVASSFGFDAPVVRARAWHLLRDLHAAMPEVLDRHVEVYGTVAMSAAWQERDTAVQRAMLDALLPVLKARPSLWMVGQGQQPAPARNRGDEDEDESGDEESEGTEDEGGDDDDDEEEGNDDDSSDEQGNGGGGTMSRSHSTATSHPRSYTDFLRWLQTGCGGAPTLGYPTVLVFLSTLPTAAFDATSHDQSSEFLNNLYSALYSRDLDSDPAGSRAFLTSFCECTVYLASKVFRNDSAEETLRSADAAKLAQQHLGLVWRELVLALAPVSGEQADDEALVDAVSEGKARKARIGSMGDQRIASELIGGVRKLYNIDQDGRVGAGILQVFRGDLLSAAESASLASIDPSSSASSSDTQHGLTRAIGILAGLLLAPAVMTDAARASKVRSAAAEVSQEVLAKAAASFNQNAASAANDSAGSTGKLDAQASLMASVVRALTAAGVSIDDSTLEALERAASQSLPQLTMQRNITPSVASSFLAAYLPVCSDAEAQLRTWNEVLASVARLSNVADQVEVLGELIAAAEAAGPGSGMDHLKQAEASSGLDEVAISLTARLCDAEAEAGSDAPLSKLKARDVVCRLMIAPKPFVEVTVAEQMLAIVTSTIEHLRYASIDHALSASSSGPGSTERTRAARVLPDLIGCLKAWVSAGSRDDKVRKLLASSTSSGVVAAVFDLAFFCANPASMATSVESALHSAAAPSFRSTATAALELWKLMISIADQPAREQVLQAGLASSSEQLLDTKVPVASVVSAAEQISRQLPATAGGATAVLPTTDDLDAMLVRCARTEPNATLSILDPSVPQSGPEDEASASIRADYDAEGLSSYARTALALVRLLRNDRDLARQQRQRRHLHHAVWLALLAEDELLQPGSSKQCFAPDAVSRPLLTTILQESVGVATAMLSAEAERIDAQWHLDLVATLQKREVSTRAGLGQVLGTVWSLAREHPRSSHLARLFGRLLSGCLSFGSVSPQEGERWLKLGRSVSDGAAGLAQATIIAVKPYVQETQAYDRLRNELAANLAGVPASKANDQGLALLRLLVGAAPGDDADAPLIPQQRAIFLLQTLQKWIASDEDIDEEINVRLAQIFVALIPIVQDVAGSHVDFFFDLVESNLDVAALADEASLPGLYFSLRLLETLRDFALRNSSLRGIWKERKEACLDLVRDLFVSLADDVKTEGGAPPRSSTPKEACAELIVDLVREVPSKSFDLDVTSAPLCKLMTHSAVHDVQVVSYRLLSASIKDRVKGLVVEAAVDKGLLSDAEQRQKLSFPAALLDNVADSLDAQLGLLVDEEDARRASFGYFLSWIAIFDHFEDASLQLKALFVAELEKRALVSDSLLPSVFALAGLLNEERRPFDPARWVVDEVYLDEIDPSPLAVVQVLAAHVYFRALIHIPTLIRNWYLDIKDRQFSMLVSSFTTRHCTPLIAARELSHLREPDALSRLQDEAMAIKVLSTNEVVATYTVDEHPMEIGVRIPPDFPLHGVEIRDIRRVGVSEAQWRAWLLAVQQLITGQNGLIFDALSLFKRNAEVQFEGLEECAICYSIISPMDRSLPTKPCKTCKNKFHAGCLFKWISTSGSSTCPLCRSIL